jgi:hypothetical protein
MQGVWDKERHMVMSEIVKDCALMKSKNSVKQKEE